MIRTSRLSPTFEELSSMVGFVDGGYASLESNVLQIYWHGELSAEAQESIQRANNRGLDVQVKYVPYSTEEFNTIVDGIFSALHDEQIHINSITTSRGNELVEIGVPLTMSNAEFTRAQQVVDLHAEGLDVVLVRKDLELVVTYPYFPDEGETPQP